MNPCKKHAGEPLFSRIFEGLQEMSQKGRSGYIFATISTSVGSLVFSLGLVFIQKVDGFTYSYFAQLKICLLTGRTNEHY